MDQWYELAKEPVPAPKGSLDSAFLLGPFESLEALCSLANAADAIESCHWAEVKEPVSPPFVGLAVVSSAVEGKASEIYFAARTDKGWYVTEQSVIYDGTKDGLDVAWAIEKVSADGPRLRVDWFYVTTEREDARVPAPGVLALRLCGPGGKDNPDCADLFPKSFAGKERHVLFCGVGASARPTCTDMIKGIERDGKLLQLSVEPDGKGGVVVDAVKQTLRDPDVFSERYEAKFHFP